MTYSEEIQIKWHPATKDEWMINLKSMKYKNICGEKIKKYQFVLSWKNVRKELDETKYLDYNSPSNS